MHLQYFQPLRDKERQASSEDAYFEHGGTGLLERFPALVDRCSSELGVAPKTFAELAMAAIAEQEGVLISACNELDLDVAFFLGYLLAAAAEMDDPAARGGIYASYCKSIIKLHER